MSQPSLDLDVDPSPTLRVSELTAAIGAAVRRGFPTELWVRGEIDSLSRSGAGHIYFDLVEGVGNERVAVRVTLFRSVAVAVERHLARHQMKLENGLEVRLMGRVELYEQRGQINLRMSGIDPTYTLGRLAQDRDRLVKILQAERLVERNGALALAAVPLRVGLVTSRGSAAHRRLRARARGERPVMASAACRQPGAGRRGRRVGRARARRARPMLGRRDRAHPWGRQPQRARGVRRRGDRADDRGGCRYRCSRASVTRSTGRWPTSSPTRRSRRPRRARASSSSGCADRSGSWAAPRPRSLAARGRRSTTAIGASPISRRSSSATSTTPSTPRLHRTDVAGDRAAQCRHGPPAHRAPTGRPRRRERGRPGSPRAERRRALPRRRRRTRHRSRSGAGAGTRVLDHS